MKFKEEKTKKGIWTDWIRPRTTNYHMECCDCGLVHTINFRAIKLDKKDKTGSGTGTVLSKDVYAVEMKLRRNETYTKQERKKLSTPHS